MPWRQQQSIDCYLYHSATKCGPLLYMSHIALSVCNVSVLGTPVTVSCTKAAEPIETWAQGTMCY